MTKASLAGNGQQKTVEELLCSTKLPDGPQGQLKFIAVLNSFLSVTAFLGNALILIALHKESSLHPPFCFVALEQLISVLVLFRCLSLLPIACL